MAKGILIHCLESVFIDGKKEFLKGGNYLMVNENKKIFVINRNSVPFEIEEEQRKKLFATENEKLSILKKIYYYFKS